MCLTYPVSTDILLCVYFIFSHVIAPDSPIASAKKPKSLAKRLDDSSLNSPMKVVRKASSLTSPNAKYVENQC